MYGAQITCALKADPYTRRHFAGCYPIDRMPLQRKAPVSFVVNSDPHDMPGTHWVCVYVDTRLAVFFDSYGKPASFYSNQLAEYLARETRSKSLWINRVQLQSNYSDLCGQYCMHALMTLSRTGNPNHILRPFSIDRSRNDRWVLWKFYRLRTKYKHCNLKNVRPQFSVPFNQWLI